MLNTAALYIRLRLLSANSSFIGVRIVNIPKLRVCLRARWLVCECPGSCFNIWGVLNMENTGVSYALSTHLDRPAKHRLLTSVSSTDAVGAVTHLFVDMNNDKRWLCCQFDQAPSTVECYVTRERLGSKWMNSRCKALRTATHSTSHFVLCLPVTPGCGLFTRKRQVLALGNEDDEVPMELVRLCCVPPELKYPDGIYPKGEPTARGQREYTRLRLKHTSEAYKANMHSNYLVGALSTSSNTLPGQVLHNITCKLTHSIDWHADTFVAVGAVTHKS
eukprot:309382-Prorocentrum_minimum.AAC.4